MCFRPPTATRTVKCPDCGALNQAVKKNCTKCQADLSVTKINPVNWFTIPVNDLEKAKTFYEAVFGYALAAHDAGTMRMAVFPAQEGIMGTNGSLVQANGYKPAEEGCVVYLAVNDIPKTLAKIEENGGKILQPQMAMGDLGYLAQFRDCEGNRVGLYSPAAITKLNPVNWFMLPVHDLAKAKRFYEKALSYSLTINKMGSLSMNWFPLLPKTAGSSGSLVQAEGYTPSENGCAVYLSVNDIAKALEKVAANGGQILQPQTDLGGCGCIAHFLDCEGNRVGLYAYQAK
ncbi:MAG: putative glyoxalase [Firmicutes bacterium]|nr:putative glyoxalase [Bacillota bacterium]